MKRPLSGPPPNTWNWATLVDTLSLHGQKSWTQRGKTTTPQHWSSGRSQGESAAWVPSCIFTAEGLPAVQSELPTNQLVLPVWKGNMLSAGLFLNKRESMSLPTFMFPLKNKSLTKQTDIEFYKGVMINALVPGSQKIQRSYGEGFIFLQFV